MSDSPRRLDRDRVLTLLYEAEAKDISASELLADLEVPPSDFVAQTTLGVWDEQKQLDETINYHAIGWQVDRMARLDVLAMRIAIWELRNRPELSKAIVITEALELVQRYSTDESTKFVNGVLSAVSDQPSP